MECIGSVWYTRGTTILPQFNIDTLFGKGNFLHNLVIWGKFQRYEQYEDIWRNTSGSVLFAGNKTSTSFWLVYVFIYIYIPFLDLTTYQYEQCFFPLEPVEEIVWTIQVHLNDILENMKYYQTKELVNVRFVWCSCLCLIGPLTPYESFRLPPNPVAQQSERLKDWWPSSFSRLCKMSTWHLHMTSFQNAQCMMYLRVTFIYPWN